MMSSAARFDMYLTPAKLHMQQLSSVTIEFFGLWTRKVYQNQIRTQEKLVFCRQLELLGSFRVLYFSFIILLSSHCWDTNLLSMREGVLRGLSHHEGLAGRQKSCAVMAQNQIQHITAGISLSYSYSNSQFNKRAQYSLVDHGALFENYLILLT